MTHTLTINLAGVVSNWQILRKQLASGVDCGAVVKADAYGLGIERVMPVLYSAGCRSFYLANIDEATQALFILESLGGTARRDTCLYVLTGCAPGEEHAFLSNGIVPVLISDQMLQRWVQAVKHAAGKSVRSVLKLNSGMGRLGLESAEFQLVLEHPELLQLAGVDMIMSHLACADDPGHPLNQQQQHRFSQALNEARRWIPGLRGSLANSAGVLLGPEYHFEAVRPGIGLYGGFSQSDEVGCALQDVVSLHLPVLQTRDLPMGESVGYGATRYFSQPAKLAVVAGGYADGLFRSLGNKGACWVADPLGGSGWLAPIVGRISMDTTVVDITGVPPGVVREGSRLEFIGAHLPIDNIASAAGTISYEVLTSLGSRYNRYYTGEAAS